MYHLSKILTLFALSLLLTSCNESGGGGGDNSSARTVVVFGDSITSDYNYPGTPPWPDLMQSMRPEWTIINRAEGSERMIGVRAKASSAITEDTDAVVILAGTINALFGDTATFSNDLASVIRIGKARGAKVLVCTIPAMVGPRIIYASSIDRVNTLIRQTASAEGAVLVDIYSELGTDPARFPDNTHPDLDGQRIIAMAVREKI